jgi:hypothetical protein
MQDVFEEINTNGQSYGLMGRRRGWTTWRRQREMSGTSMMMTTTDATINHHPIAFLDSLCLSYLGQHDKGVRTHHYGAAAKTNPWMQVRNGLAAVQA